MNITIDQAIKIIETHMEVHKIGEYLHVMIGEALNMALAALRDQQTSTKLDRNRWEGCEYCKDAPASIMKGFCYACGRPLTEEAWAELEKKLEV